VSLRALTCEECGGAISLQAGQRVPRCLFCGSPALHEAAPPQGVEPPAVAIPFAVDEEGARAAFRAFASGSIWYPGDLRRARLDLNAILLPAWSWSGYVETHYAALVPARTRSGKRPVSGAETAPFEGVLVPSSTALTRAELAAISPFDPGSAAPFDPQAVQAPFELGSLTRTAARQAGVDAMKGLHVAALRQRCRASRLHASCLFHDVEGLPLLLPVYVGAYRRKGQLYRVVINGQTARLTGQAPYSWARIGCAVFVVVALLVFIMLLLGGGALVAGAVR